MSHIQVLMHPSHSSMHTFHSQVHMLARHLSTDAITHECCIHNHTSVSVVTHSLKCRSHTNTLTLACHTYNWMHATAFRLICNNNNNKRKSMSRVMYPRHEALCFSLFLQEQTQDIFLHTIFELSSIVFHPYPVSYTHLTLPTKIGV